MTRHVKLLSLVAVMVLIVALITIFSQQTKAEQSNQATVDNIK